jgi:hypothetical protein
MLTTRLRRSNVAVMDGLLILAILALIGVVAALVWRPPSGRARTPEEALEREALRREQDRAITEATYQGDRSNIRH